MLAVAAALDYEQVRRLKVAVDDAAGVRGSKSAGSLLAQGNYVGCGEGVVREVLLEGFAVE